MVPAFILDRHGYQPGDGKLGHRKSCRPGHARAETPRWQNQRRRCRRGSLRLRNCSDHRRRCIPEVCGVTNVIGCLARDFLIWFLLKHLTFCERRQPAQDNHKPSFFPNTNTQKQKTQGGLMETFPCQEAKGQRPKLKFIIPPGISMERDSEVSRMR